MSQLQLSDQLLRAVQGALESNDERARDPGVALQYLAAIMGYIVGTQDMPADARQEALEELAALARHVVDDVGRQQQRTEPPAQEAFGIWRAPRS